MAHIIVDDVQAKIITEADGSIEIRDRSGRHLGYVAHGFSAEDVAIANQRRDSGERRHTTKEVLDYLASRNKK